MAEVPVTFRCFVYPKNKTVAPFPATIVGYASITGLEVGGGPIEPPPDIPVEPPLEIWGPTDPRPDVPIAFPPDWIGGVPPELPDPPVVTKPHPGWNWSAAKSQWYFLFVPGEGQAQPKRK